MITSGDRILTTHVGSLPRNETLSDLLIRREAGEAIDKALMAAEMDKAVRHVVERQARPASTSAMTASSSASASRPMCRGACPASAASPSAAAGASSRSSPSSWRRWCGASRM